MERIFWCIHTRFLYFYVFANRGFVLHTDTVLTVQGVFKGKNCKERVICLGGVGGYVYVAIGSKSREDFCSFPQKYLVAVKTCSFSFWLAILRSLGSQAVFGTLVAFLGISRYTGWGTWGGVPAGLDSHKIKPGFKMALFSLSSSFPPSLRYLGAQSWVPKATTTDSMVVASPNL